MAEKAQNYTVGIPAGLNEEKVTLSQLVAKEYMVLSAMIAVMTAFKHALTFRAPTAMCENSFSMFKNDLASTDAACCIEGKPISSSLHLRMTSVGNSKMKGRRCC